MSAALSILARAREQVLSGRTAEARRLLAALNDQPLDAGMLPVLTELLRRCGDTTAAVAVGRQAVAVLDGPAGAVASNNLGLALQQAGDVTGAEAAFRQALSREPGQARAGHNLGGLLLRAGRLAEAAPLIEGLARRHPDYDRAHHALALLRRHQGRHREAADILDAMLARWPGDLAARRERALVAQHLGDDGRAGELLRRLVAEQPDDAASWRALGQFLEHRRDPAGAATATGRAVALDPGNLALLGELENQRRDLCDWSGWPANIHRLLAETEAALTVGRPAPIGLLAAGRFPVSAPVQRALAEAWARPVAEAVGPLTEPSPRRRRPGEPLRVGWLSHEFGHNVVGHMLVGLLPAFPRARITTIGLGYGRDDGSERRRRIIAACDAFIDLAGADDAEAARLIREAGVDVLVDVNACFANGRPHIAARRPAPVRVSYLSPLTSGAPWMQWFISDPVATPAAHARHFSERIARMPPSYLPAPGPQHVARPPSRASLGLPEDARVLASFNRQDKILPDVFDGWLELLRRHPDTVLWLAAGNPVARRNLARHAGDRGVDPARLVFAETEPDMARHLGRLAHAELFLDTFPHTAHVTAVDALWAGLPVLTRMGDTFASRVAASLLTALELPELICTGADAWLARAHRLLERPDELAGLRRRLVASRSTAGLWRPEVQAGRLADLFGQMLSAVEEGRVTDLHAGRDAG